MTGIEIIEVFLLPVFFTASVTFLALFMNKRNAMSDLEEELDRIIEKRDSEIKATKVQYAKELAYHKKLAQEASDRANRNGAIAEGLQEELAALKAYDPEEIEERLKKIREIKAEEERKKSLENLEKLRQEVNVQIVLSMLNSGYGFPASACCSIADQQRIYWR